MFTIGPAIILEIFHRHARTKEAQLQVELARLKYLAPRERLVAPKSDEAAGEAQEQSANPFTSWSADKCAIVSRTSTRTRCRSRRTSRASTSPGRSVQVSIVGYTNAGKSSLMRALTSSDVLVAINCSLPSIRPFGRCSRRPNLASSYPTRLVLFETFRMISLPHFDRLSTKRWMLRFYFMWWMHLIHRCALTFKSREKSSGVSTPENFLRFSS